MMKDFKTLEVWKKAHHVTLEIYRVTQGFPNTETYGLVSQMRRSAASIPTNIAEGCGRNGDAELAHFFQIAMGSASELEYQILLSHDLGYLMPDQAAQLETNTTEVKRMLASFIKKFRQ